MTNGFISAEYELPPCDGIYEVLTVHGVIECEYLSEAGGFIPMPGMAGEPPWRYALPDADDLAEFRARIGYCYPVM